MTKTLRVCTLLLCYFSTPTLHAWSSIGVYETGHYHEKSSHLYYANAHAPQGGTLRIGIEGTFDTLNPYSLRGAAPLFMNFVFQTLGQQTLDEPSTSYPNIAEDFFLSPDKMSMKVKLHKDAKFSDGHPLSSEDVVFSFHLLVGPDANPRFKTYWSDIKEVKAESPVEVLVSFHRFKRELPLLVSEIPVLPKHIYSKGRFSKDHASKAVGSGPYIVEDYRIGHSIRFRKDPKFWAKQHFMNAGRYNFDHVIVDYFRDPAPLVQAFKSGTSDMFIAYNMQTWQSELQGKVFERNWILKEEWEQSMNQGAKGYFFNLRKPVFQDIRVRKAITLAFDFAWTNRTLFHDAYLPSHSIFENSPFKARDLPSKEELSLLRTLKKQFPDDVPNEVLNTPVAALGKNLNVEARLELARSYLKEAGYRFTKGLMRGAGGTLSLELLLPSRSALRIAEPFQRNLARLGVNLQLVFKDRASFMQRLNSRNFDLAALTIAGSSHPGQEQFDFWHSHSANTKFSRNFYGLANKAVDALIERLLQSQTHTELEVNSHNLDRLVHHLHIAVPNWYTDKYRVAYWNRFQHSQTLPLYYVETQMIEFLWWDSQKEARLKEAMRKGEKF